MLRYALYLVSFAVVFAVLAAAWVSRASRPPAGDEPDPGALGAIDPEWERERRREADLEAQFVVLAGVHRARMAVLRRLEESRLTLLEAAARYRDIDAARKHFRWEVFRDVYPGA